EAGSDGYVRRQYMLTYENGEEVSRQLVSLEYVAPSDRVVALGSKVVLPPLDLPDATPIDYTRTLQVYATWYNAASSGGDGITATGVLLTKGICAVDPSVIPLGTHLYVPGYGNCLAADTGGAIVGNMIDLGYPGSTVGDCCTGWMTIYILD
ncbi:MAG: 3D domain-containing protein, partial [Dehalococcoidia bacterium]